MLIVPGLPRSGLFVSLVSRFCPVAGPPTLLPRSPVRPGIVSAGRVSHGSGRPVCLSFPGRPSFYQTMNKTNSPITIEDFPAWATENGPRLLHCNVCGGRRYHDRLGIQQFKCHKLILWRCGECGNSKATPQ